MTREEYEGLEHQEGKVKLGMEPKQEVARADGRLHPAGGASHLHKDSGERGIPNAGRQLLV